MNRQASEQRIRPAPIRKTVHVPIPPEGAFDLFLGQMGSWWSPGHSILKVPLKAIVIEPRVGGRWYEVGEDGSEYQWGRVVAWDPPARALLAWQLTAAWEYDPGFETEVEISFAADGGGTRVTFEHRGLERFGDGAAEQREGMDQGWGMLLDGFVARARQAG